MNKNKRVQIIRMTKTDGYLKNLVSSKESSISGDYPIPIDFLDNDVNQRRFIATHDANS